MDTRCSVNTTLLTITYLHKVSEQGKPLIPHKAGRPQQPHAIGTFYGVKHFSEDYRPTTSFWGRVPALAALPAVAIADRSNAKPST